MFTISKFTFSAPVRTLLLAAAATPGWAFPALATDLKLDLGGLASVGVDLHDGAKVDATVHGDSGPDVTVALGGGSGSNDMTGGTGGSAGSAGGGTGLLTGLLGGGGSGTAGAGVNVSLTGTRTGSGDTTLPQTTGNAIAAARPSDRAGSAFDSGPAPEALIGLTLVSSDDKTLAIITGATPAPGGGYLLTLQISAALGSDITSGTVVLRSATPLRNAIRLALTAREFLLQLA